MDLFENPFNILQVSNRDNKRTIIAKSNDILLSHDEKTCNQASADLINPAKRLRAEIAWLPGLSPNRAKDLMSLLEESPIELFDNKNQKSIAWVNLFGSALFRLNSYEKDVVTEMITILVNTFTHVAIDDVIDQINRDREVARFPEVTDKAIVENEINERRLFYVNAIKHALNNLYPEELVETVTHIVDTFASNNVNADLILIHDMVDMYETEAQLFFNKEREILESIISKIENASDNTENSINEPIISDLFNRLEGSLSSWKYASRPIQVSAKIRGIRHVSSEEVVKKVRLLSINLFNEHNDIENAKKITTIIKQLFSEMAEMAEFLEEDLMHLNEISESVRINKLTEPIYNLCEKAAKDAENKPAIANQKARAVIGEIEKFLENPEKLDYSKIDLTQFKDYVAFIIMQCAILYGNEKHDWLECSNLLNNALKYANEPELKTKIEENNRVALNNYFSN